MQKAFDITARFFPKENKVDVKLDLLELIEDGKPAFYLNKNLVIDTCTDGEQAIQVTMNTEENKYLDTAGYPVYLEKGKRHIKMHYTGEFRKSIRHTNFINEDYVEISNVSAIFPVGFQNEQIEGYHMTLEIPVEYEVISNGTIDNQTILCDKKVLEISSIDAEPDIFFVAAKAIFNLKLVTGVAAYYFKQQYEGIAQDKVAICEEILALYETMYGKLKKKADLNCIIVPRNGFGYTISPCIVFTENRETALGYDNYWITYMFAHELSHCYWRLSKVYRVDGWIDESMAEYSTLKYLEKKLGREGLWEVIKKHYIKKAKTGSDNSIVSTNKLSEDRLCNWYSKSSLVLYAAGIKYGFAMLHQLFSLLYEKYCENKQLTNEIFFQEAKGQLDAGCYEFIDNFFHKQGWDDSDIEQIQNIILNSNGN